MAAMLTCRLSFSAKDVKLRSPGYGCSIGAEEFMFLYGCTVSENGTVAPLSQPVKTTQHAKSAVTVSINCGRKISRRSESLGTDWVRVNLQPPKTACTDDERRTVEIKAHYTTLVRPNGTTLRFLCRASSECQEQTNTFGDGAHNLPLRGHDSGICDSVCARCCPPVESLHPWKVSDLLLHKCISLQDAHVRGTISSTTDAQNYRRLPFRSFWLSAISPLMPQLVGGGVIAFCVAVAAQLVSWAAQFYGHYFHEKDETSTL